MKVKIQTQNTVNGRLYRGTLDCLFKTANKEGVSGMIMKHFLRFELQARSLYRGMSAPLLGVAGINAVSFWAFGNALQLLPDQDSISSVAVAGSAAGLIQVCKIF